MSSGVHDPETLATVESLAKFPDENPNPILRVDREGVVVYANRPAEPVLQYWGSAIGERVPTDVLAAAEIAEASGENYEVELTHQGQRFCLLFVPIEDAPYFNVYGRDVTEERAHEQRVVDLARFPDEDPHPVLRIDEAGEVIYGNDPSAALLDAWNSDIGEPVPAEVAAVVERAFADHGDYEIVVECSDLVYALVVAGVPGAPYVNVYGRNITRRLKAEAELVRARDQALAASRAKSSFLANMSHELRTPMNAIIGYSEMLIEEADDKGDQVLLEDLERIHGAGRHLLTLINDILDLSKIEAGRMDVFIEEIDVAEAVALVADTAAPLLKKRGNELTIDLEDGLPRIRTDATKLRQNLLNLVSNAAKFTDDGTITIAVRRDDEMLRFTVRDTGIGMSDEQLERIFASFMQADPSTTRQYGGTGLGLTITKHFCEMVGGRIEVESEVGVGSAFTLVLPIESKKRSSAPGRRQSSVHRSASANATGHMVLVVDDDPVVQDILRITLNAAGFDVVTASSGEDGIRLARQLHPVAITLDVVMQGTDGWSVLTTLKSDPTTRDIPIVLVTISDDRGLGLALGAAEFVTKPIDREHLLAVIQSYRSSDPAPEVLIVEDDDDLRALLRRTLVKQGWTVREARHGGIALEALEDSLPRLVLLDLMMPEVDGFEFLTRMRSDERFTDIPVIVVTAKELDDADYARLGDNVAQILQKGAYSRDELLDVIKGLVRTSVGSLSAAVVDR